MKVDPLGQEIDEDKTRMVIAQQLELDLWQDLESAMQNPEAADIMQLWQEVEVAIASVKPKSQLLVAGEAISQIVEIYVKKAVEIDLD